MRILLAVRSEFILHYLKNIHRNQSFGKNESYFDKGHKINYQFL